MNALIIGGSSGLGLELAKLLKSKYRVFITGRKNPNAIGLDFIMFDIKTDQGLATAMNSVLDQIDHVDLFIYAAGFYQEGTISELSDENILLMNTVGLLAPAMLLQRILKKQEELSGFIAITSTSQWTPRLKEPIYNAVKGGLGMLASSVALDPKIKKTLLAGPAGMKTNFWKQTENDMSDYMDPTWVAGQIVSLWQGDYKYKYARILRQPPRVEVIEQR